MLFSSLPFFIFFAIVFLVYYLFSGEKQWWLIVLSGLFFFCWNDLSHSWLPILLIWITWFAGKQIEKSNSEKTRNRYLFFGIGLNVFLLVGFKYTYFFFSSTGIVGSESGITVFLREIAVPLGISYISFQSIGYLVDIKRGSIQAENSISRIAGYLLFFPKMISGPVESAAHFLPQIKTKIEFDYNRISAGVRQFGWGLFKKIVIADRLGLFVDSAYADIPHSFGISLWLSAFFFPVQLYADFSGYTDMAIGLARILGYELTPNFNNPFSAKSMVEFWRRWHMSLSTWFNEYIYTPLAIQKRHWGKWSVVYASTITFLILGLWHGANWTYVIFGSIQGCIIAVELFTNKQRKQLRKNVPEKLNALAGIVYVFVVFSFSCIFFRSVSVKEAATFLSHLFSGPMTVTAIKVALQDHAFTVTDCAIILLTIPFMFLVEIKQLTENFANASKWVRWVVYYLFLIVMVVYGINHSGFIYKQF